LTLGCLDPRKGGPRAMIKGPYIVWGPRHGGQGPIRHNHQLSKGQDTMVWGPTHGCMGPHGEMEWT